MLSGVYSFKGLGWEFTCGLFATLFIQYNKNGTAVSESETGSIVLRSPSTSILRSKALKFGSAFTLGIGIWLYFSLWKSTQIYPSHKPSKIVVFTNLVEAYYGLAGNVVCTGYAPTQDWRIWVELCDYILQLWRANVVLGIGTEIRETVPLNVVPRQSVGNKGNRWGDRWGRYWKYCRSKRVGLRSKGVGIKRKGKETGATDCGGRYEPRCRCGGGLGGSEYKKILGKNLQYWFCNTCFNVIPQKWELKILKVPFRILYAINVFLYLTVIFMSSK